MCVVVDSPSRHDPPRRSPGDSAIQTLNTTPGNGSKWSKITCNSSGNADPASTEGTVGTSANRYKCACSAASNDNVRATAFNT